MQNRIPQSTSFTTVLKVYLTDHVTPATGKTVAITISKNTGAFGNPSAGATNATEIANGWYYFTGSTTDSGTIGPLIVLGTASGCDNADQAYDVVNANNAGLAALPNTAVTTNASLLTSGSGTDQLLVASGNVTQIPAANAVVQSGTAQGGGSQTITLSAGASATNNLYGGCIIKIYGGTGAGQTRVCQNYNGSTKVQNVDNAWTTQPDNTSVYSILAYHSPATDGGQNVLIGSTQTFNNTGTWTGNLTGSVGSVTGNVGGNVVGSVASVTGNVGGNVVGSVASVTGAVGSVTAAVTTDGTQILGAPRNISAVADGAITVNDARWAAVCGTAGKETVVSTTYTVMTPSTGTTLRIFTLDSGTNPTSRT